MSKVISFLSKKASEYKVKYSVFYAADEDGHELEDYESNNFCEDCYDDVLAKIQSKNTGYELLPESSPEKGNFCTCENCHEIIEVSNIFDDSEYNHFLSLSKEHLLKALDRPRNCYEMMLILSTSQDNSLKEKLESRIANIQAS